MNEPKYPAHYADEGEGGFVPLCGNAKEGDEMTFFPDSTTCDECLKLFPAEPKEREK